MNTTSLNLNDFFRALVLSQSVRDGDNDEKRGRGRRGGSERTIKPTSPVPPSLPSFLRVLPSSDILFPSLPSHPLLTCVEATTSSDDMSPCVSYDGWCQKLEKATVRKNRISNLSTNYIPAAGSTEALPSLFLPSSHFGFEVWGPFCSGFRGGGAPAHTRIHHMSQKTTQ